MPVSSSRAVALVLSVFSLAAVAVPTLHAGNRPEPSVYPLPDNWYIDFKHGAPKRIVVDLPGQKTPTAYWYLTYTITNNSKEDRDFLPEFEMVTQDGKIHRGDVEEIIDAEGKVHSRGILPGVFQAIKNAEHNDLLLPRSRIVGPIHEGEDQAKDGVVIWQEPMPRMGTFSIYCAGLSSEFVNATDDKGAPMLAPDGGPIALRRTLQLEYVIWGDEVAADKDEVHKKLEKWIMR